MKTSTPLLFAFWIVRKSFHCLYCNAFLFGITLDKMFASLQGKYWYLQKRNITEIKGSVPQWIKADRQYKLLYTRVHSNRCVPPTHWPHLVVSAGGDVCPGGALRAWEGPCMPRGCVCLGGMCTWGHVRIQGACIPGVACMPRGACLPCTRPPDRILDTRLWKHYLFA